MYVLALVLYASLGLPSDVSTEIIIKHAFFLHTMESREIANSLNPAFWSLPPEVEFYIVLPLLARCAGSSKSVGVMTVLALLMHLVITWMSPNGVAVNFAVIVSVHLPGLLIEFMLGVVAWWFVGCHRNRITRLALIIAGLSLWFLMAIVFLHLGQERVDQIAFLRGNTGLVAAFSFMLLVIGLVGLIQQPKRWLVWSATVMGNLSYGVYLFHNAAPKVLHKLQTLVSAPIFGLMCLALTLLVAQILYWIWEAPCRVWGRSLAKKLVKN